MLNEIIFLVKLLLKLFLTCPQGRHHTRRFLHSRHAAPGHPVSFDSL